MPTADHALLRLPQRQKAAPLRIAMLAPPWIAVPPVGYGRVEAVVELLCGELVARGHDVTLFAAPGSRSDAHVRTLLETAHPDTIGSALHESDHVAAAFAAIEEAAEGGGAFDVIHDHCAFTALAMSDRVSVPVVHTMHSSLIGEVARFYARHASRARLVAVSHAQAALAPAGVFVSAVVPNPVAVARWPLRTGKDDYLLWIGRMDERKGAHRAIRAARLARRRIVLAGPVQPGHSEYFRRQIEPHIDGRRVSYAGEVSGVMRQELFARAAALLMPIRWDEPFGMVMPEALACGTPVIAFAEGAAREIVIDGVNGRLVADETEMARAVGGLGAIDPRDCRESVRSRYDTSIVAGAYVAVYRRAVAATSGRAAPPLQVAAVPLAAGEALPA